MAIIVENIDNGLKRTYSDRGVYIRKKDYNEEYGEAIDLADASFEYEETEKDIAPKKEQTEVE